MVLEFYYVLLSSFYTLNGSFKINIWGILIKIFYGALRNISVFCLRFMTSAVFTLFRHFKTSLWCTKKSTFVPRFYRSSVEQSTHDPDYQRIHVHLHHVIICLWQKIVVHFKRFSCSMVSGSGKKNHSCMLMSTSKHHHFIAKPFININKD